MRADRTLPPLILVPGHSPSHEQKCLTLAKRLKSGPISDSTVSTEVTASPLMRVRSTPAQRASAVRRSKPGVFLPARLAGPASLTSWRPSGASNACSLASHSVRRWARLSYDSSRVGEHHYFLFALAHCHRLRQDRQRTAAPWETSKFDSIS